MKTKASITLSTDVLQAIDEIAKSSSRSEVIEQALRDFLAARARLERDRRDTELLNQHADEINRETAEFLSIHSWTEFDQ
jgi:metal-responsive CopG/Arc/MetJ family transcriptional regulator